jgi:hypothetical protein
MFKDAYMQEAIVDKVRAVEFDMESTAEAEVGSVLASVANTSAGFERIADEDDDASSAADVAKKKRKAPAKAHGKFSKDIETKEVGWR